MSASRDGGDDDQLIAIVDRCVEATAEADVFIVEVVRHEWVWLSLIIDEACGQGREATGEVGDGFADGGAGGRQRALTIGQASENARERNRQRHKKRALGAGWSCWVLGAGCCGRKAEGGKR